MKDFSKILLVLIVNDFSPILWCEHDMVLTQPFGMCKAIRLVRHEITSSCNIGLDTFIICRGDLYRITYCLHPRSRWIFALAIPFFGTRKTPWSTHTKVHNKKDHPDIFLRMLKPAELKIMQGFPEDYIIGCDIEWKKMSVAEQVAKIGNSVSPPVAKALVEANCRYLKEGERKPIIDYERLRKTG